MGKQKSGPGKTFRLGVEDEAEAVALANDSAFALSASVWTRDRKRGERLARQIDAGAVMVNDCISYFGISEAPHGGTKMSGIGRTHSRLGLMEMVRVKYLDTDWAPGIPKPWWYGYGFKTQRFAQGFVEFLFGQAPTQRARFRNHACELRKETVNCALSPMSPHG